MALLLASAITAVATELPDDFVYLSDVCPSIIQSVRYATNENFVGNVVDGYEAPKIIVKRKTAEGLKKAQKIFLKKGYSLVVYDGYRPQRAVDHFVRWAKNGDFSTKEKYYPTKEKADLFKGYISTRSVHCSGYAVDLTIIKQGHKLLNPVTVKERRLLNGDMVNFVDDGTVDMGVGFYFLHEASWADADCISEECRKNRQILKNVMLRCGFKPYANEWWHFELKDQNSTKSYDFAIR